MKIKQKKLHLLFKVWRSEPGWVFLLEKYLGKTIASYAELWHSELLRQLKEEEQGYYQEELPKVRATIQQWKEENKEEIIRYQQARISLLRQELEIKKKILEKKLEHYGELEEKERLLAEAEKLERQLNATLTSEMIERARNYPLEQLVQINAKGFATCVFHSPDKNPSMYCKKGYAYCFACGEQADAIKLYQTLHGVSFPEAVKSLQ